jgi:DNA gyrase/topoisomerase IV subunit A
MNVPKGATIVAASIVPGGQDQDIEVVTLAADGAAKRSSAAEYPSKGRGGKGLVTGTENLRWCGVAADLHTGGEDADVLRLVDLTEARRSGRGADLGHPITGPVVAEQDAADTSETA